MHIIYMRIYLGKEKYNLRNEDNILKYKKCIL